MTVQPTGLSDATKFLLQQHGNNTDAILTEWQKASEALAQWKEYESRLRMAVFETRFTSHVEGVNRVDLNYGWQLKVTMKYNYNLKNKDGQTEAALERIAATGNEGAFIADRLVRWSPELSISEYRKLSDTLKTEIDKCLEIKPGMPTIEMEAPK